MEICLTRREVLHRASRYGLKLGLTAGGVILLEGCTNAIPTCADPMLLNAGEAQMRRTLEYVERTANVSEQCDGCAFFRENDGDCGHCEILNGAVSRQGYCNSWAGRN
ncbi:MAG: high-potential iron-sulfur protein [Gammaproteobacteria bacterium]|nr:high-potential iron-sulfur protein [Gammaproteobacteria bacterium]